MNNIMTSLITWLNINGIDVFKGGAKWLVKTLKIQLFEK